MNKPIRPKGRLLPISCPPGLQVRMSKGRGRGVFATRRFRKGDLVEISPVIEMAEKEWKRLSKTVLDHYVYDWADGSGCAMVLGLGSLYNHSYDPNIRNFIDEGRRAMEWRAERTIRKGEELTVNYNADEDPAAELWFKSR